MSETPKARAARLRRLRANNPGYSTSKNRAWQEKNREKYLAHKAVENALRKGTLVRQPCERCGGPAQAHHEDYGKQLDVTWLCRKHHAERHRELKCEAA